MRVAMSNLLELLLMFFLDLCFIMICISRDNIFFFVKIRVSPIILLSYCCPPKKKNSDLTVLNIIPII